MSITVSFTSSSKRLNSTQQLVMSTTHECNFKNGCSMLRPTLFLELNTSSFPTYTNFKIGGKYYHVTDIRSVRNNLFEVSGKIDVLATYKSQIGASTQYVTRSASNHNGRVVDNYYPALARNTHDASIITSPFTTDLDSGCFIVGIQGKGSGGNGGAVTYYRASSSSLKTLVNYMLSSPSMYNVSEISEEFLRCVFNPLQYIVSCMWFPFTAPITTGGLSFGWWDAEISGINRVSSLSWGTNMSFTIPKHPKSSRGQYLNLQPFAKYRIEAGPWGIIPLDNFNLLDSTSLTCEYKVDLMTGTGRFNVKYRDKLAYEAAYTAQIGVPIQLGQNMLNQGALTGLINDGAGILKSSARLDPAGLLKTGMSAIGDAAELTQSVPSSMGSNGTLSFNNVFALMADFLDVADEDVAQRGRPLCSPVTISTLSGFVMCANAEIALPATETEKEEVLSYLNSGFFYE